MEPFAAALAAIQSGLRQYVASRPVALQDMYLARFLPPVRSTEAEVKAGNFRITTSPAPITAVDSAYAKVGGIKVQDFNASGFKITAETKLSEANQDQMHARAQNEIVRAYNAGDSANVQSIFENFIARLMEDGVLLSLDYGEELYRAIGVAREDKEARHAQFATNGELFGAPVGIFVSVDERMGHAQWMDLGIFLQSFMLQAVDRGLATCAQGFWRMYSEMVIEQLSLPEGYQIAFGIALGYEDASAPINQWRSSRATSHEWLSLQGFD